MLGDEENTGRAENVIETASEQVADATRTNVSDAAAALHAVTETTAEQAETVNARVTEAASAASRSAVEAFSATRERLATLATPFANPAFDTMRQSGEAFGKGLESSYAAAIEGMAEFNSKAIAAWRSNAESTLAHWQNLAGVKSLSEAITLSAEHTRKQMEALSSQTRELSSLATRIVRGEADPLKTTGR